MSENVFDPSDPALIHPALVFTDTQNRILSSIPRVVGAFSFLGSSLIVYIILHDRRQLLKNSYDRIMLGLSLFVVAASLGFTVFGPWTIPADVPFVTGARASGTVLCDIAGWFTHMTLGSVSYTAALMIYFILVIKLEWRPQKIAQRVEPWLHLVAISVPLTTGAVAVASGYMNPFEAFPGTCWITAYPALCEVSTEVECIRGRGSLAYVRILAFFPLSTVVIVVVAMVLLVLKVRATEQRMTRYQVGEQVSLASFQRTRRTAQRGLAYVFAFSIAFIPTAIFLLVFLKRPIKKPGPAFLVSFFIMSGLPLQGFFNAIIYIHPKWSELTYLHWLLIWRQCDYCSSCGKSKTGVFSCCTSWIYCCQRRFNPPNPPLDTQRPTDSHDVKEDCYGSPQNDAPQTKNDTTDQIRNDATAMSNLPAIADATTTTSEVGLGNDAEGSGSLPMVTGYDKAMVSSSSDIFLDDKEYETTSQA